MDFKRIDSRQILGLGLAAFGILALLGNFGFLRGLGNLTGFFFFAVLSAAFAAAYASRRDHYWPIIPAGVFATLALTTLIHSGSIFFFGLAATFALVYALSGQGYPRARWALYPAGSLAALGMLTLLAGLGRLFFPLILIGAGVALIYERSHRNG